MTISDKLKFIFTSKDYDLNVLCMSFIRGRFNMQYEITLITPPTQRLELYTIYWMTDQGLTFRMMHKTLFYHPYLSSYRR